MKLHLNIVGLEPVIVQEGETTTEAVRVVMVTHIPTNQIQSFLKKNWELDADV